MCSSETWIDDFLYSQIGKLFGREKRGRNHWTNARLEVGKGGKKQRTKNWATNQIHIENIAFPTPAQDYYIDSWSFDQHPSHLFIPSFISYF